MKMRGFVLIVILLASTLAHSTGSQSAHATEHVCIHKQLMKKQAPVVMDAPEGHDDAHFSSFKFETDLDDHPLNENRFSASHKAGSDPSAPENAVNGWHLMRIYLDFSFANRFIQQQPAIRAKYEMAAKLTQNVRNYFQSNLMVNFMTRMTFSGGSCQENDIPKFDMPIDLFITIKPENDQSTSYFAAAAPCYLSSRDGRPTVGAYILNFAFLKTSPLYEFLYFSTFAHEFTHILGFSDDLFPRYVNLATGRKFDSVTKTVTFKSASGDYQEDFALITTRDVVEYARNYFNCPSLQGMPLENGGGEGSAGSHWDKLFLPTEYMNPTVEYPGILSEFTFALLRGSGWYKSRVGSAQYFDWGQGMGCDYFKICPRAQVGLCSKDEIGQLACSSEYYSKSVCSAETTFTSGCPMKKGKDQSCLLDTGDKKANGEEYGPNSRCFQYMAPNNGKFATNPRCHLTYCENGGKTIVIKFGTKPIRCQQSGQKISIPNDSYQLICPDIADFCAELAHRCMNDCNGKGLCMSNGVCQCFNGYSGPDCNQSPKVAPDFYHFLQRMCYPSEVL